MKTKILGWLAVGLLVGLAYVPTANATYSASAVAYGFTDISGTGTSAGINCDDCTTQISPVGFNFGFYGTSYSSVFVSSNGLLTFGSANSAFTNTDLTTSPTQAAIAVFWDDMYTFSPANVFYQLVGSDLIIQWNNLTFFSGGTSGDTLTFQAILSGNGNIRFNYADLVSGIANGNNGASATVGIKAAGTQGPDRLLLLFNNGPNAFVGTGQSTLISFTQDVPEPGTLALLGLGLAGLGLSRRRKAA